MWRAALGGAGASPHSLRGGRAGCAPVSSSQRGGNGRVVPPTFPHRMPADLVVAGGRTPRHVPSSTSRRLHFQRWCPFFCIIREVWILGLVGVRFDNQGIP